MLAALGELVAENGVSIRIGRGTILRMSGPF